MPIVSSTDMLLKAQKNDYAVAAFNFENMEMLQAILEKAQELKAPVILQTTPSTVKYIGLSTAKAMVQAIASEFSIPVALHLDHCEDLNFFQTAANIGYTSLMIDGSKFEFNENVELTKSAKKIITGQDIHLEVELGKVGGKEDKMENKSGPSYPSVEEAVNFANRTGIDSLAIGIGTAHGIYKGEPKLNIALLEQIKASVKIPLVLHGASGLADKVVKECIAKGICKVNFATELRIAFSKGIKDYLSEDPSEFDPKKYIKLGKEYVKKVVENKIVVCGCDNKY
jgi:tagatose 1,6-diphosphate aldolase GatY/KbaY